MAPGNCIQPRWGRFSRRLLEQDSYVVAGLLGGLYACILLAVCLVLVQDTPSCRGPACKGQTLAGGGGPTTARTGGAPEVNQRDGWELALDIKRRVACLGIRVRTINLDGKIYDFENNSTSVSSQDSSINSKNSTSNIRQRRSVTDRGDAVQGREQNFGEGKSSAQADQPQENIQEGVASATSGGEGGFFFARSAGSGGSSSTTKKSIPGKNILLY